MTNEVHNQVIAKPNINATNHSIANTSTNKGANSHSIHHEWVWFRLEGQSGCSLGPAWIECQSIALTIHQILQTQWLNHCDVLKKFDSEVDVEWVVQKL